MSLKKLVEEITKPILQEGVNDPGILKAVFLAGGPGSGKSYVASGLFGIPKKINVSASGLKLINQDSELERMLKKYGFGLDLDDMPEELFRQLTDPDYEDYSGVRGRAKELTASRKKLYMNGRLGMIIDGTGHKYGSIKKKKKELEEFIYRLLPNDDKRNYMMKLVASCIEGHTSDERFHILTGTASNGKSKFIELINESLGDYSFCLPISLLTQKRQNANNANPEMAKTKGMRFGYLQEPDKGDEINVGYMKEITGGDQVDGVLLEGGEALSSGMVIISAGVRPNMELAKDLGLDHDKGIKVDEHLRTNRADIYAAGDVAEFKGMPYGIWPAAMEQGKIAGNSMAGGDRVYEGTVMANTLKVVGVDLASAGNIDAENEFESQVFTDEKVYKKIVFENDQIIGCIMLGDTKGFNKMTKAISEKMDVSKIKDQIVSAGFNL